MTKIESKSFSGDYTLNVLSGNYEIGVAFFALNLTYDFGVRRVNLISSTSRSSTIDVGKSYFYAAFVRGVDNRIYYTVCNFNQCVHTWTQVWSMVNYLPLPGSTVEAPSAAAALSPFGAEIRGIHLAVRGGSDSIWYSYLYEVAFEPGKAMFSGWQRLSGSTPSRPVIVTDGIRVYLVVRGKDDRIYCNILEGGKWKGWQRLPTGSTIDAPAAAYLQGRLHIVVRGKDGYSLWHSWIDLATGGFSGWFKIPGSTPSVPYLTTDESKLYLAVRGRDNGIYYNVYDGGEWLGWVRLPTGSTSTAPAILVGKGLIHFVVVGMDGRSIYYSYRNLTTGESSPWNQLPGSTTSPVALTSC